jgi:hypothetical protein
MRSRERLSWCLAALLALAAVGGWGFYYGECRARAEERERWRANIRLLESHALRGMMLESEKAKEQALPSDKTTSHCRVRVDRTVNGSLLTGPRSRLVS